MPDKVCRSAGAAGKKRAWLVFEAGACVRRKAGAALSAERGTEHWPEPKAPWDSLELLFLFFLREKKKKCMEKTRRSPER